MPDIAGLLGTLTDLALVIIGFGLIIFLHELGHFVAARWAGIRVLSFAMGFGPAAISFRKGLGLRLGSSEREYFERLNAAGSGQPAVEGRAGALEISPTEYRLNWLPFGGYVKMLGQEDLNPEAVSSAPDSFQSCVPWKKMVVISAGVAMNIVVAAILFMIVFGVGLKTEPPIVGGVIPGTPASRAIATNAGPLGVTQPGFMPGDEILEVGGRPARQFTDVTMAAAMASRNSALDLKVKRPGVPETLNFSILPTPDRSVRPILSLGIEPARSATIFSEKNRADRDEFSKAMAALGLSGIEPGMKLVSINGRGNIQYEFEVTRAVRQSGGKPVELVFEDPSGRKVPVTLKPEPELAGAEFTLPGAGLREQPHLAGMTGVLKVAKAHDVAKKQGLRDGDVFVRLGAMEFPNYEVGLREIRTNAGRTLDAVVRRGVGPEAKDVPLALAVTRDGTIGFDAGNTIHDSALMGVPIGRFSKTIMKPDPEGGKPKSVTTSRPTPAAIAGIVPGAVVIEAGGRPVATFADLRTALLEATKSENVAVAEVPLRLRLPSGGEELAVLKVNAEDAAALRALTWTDPLPGVIFEPSHILLKSTGPLNAVSLGLAETKRIAIQTYLTFGRLFEGTVKIEHLQGPVGIAHVGTVLADRGIIWLMFFLALVSVNLAVVNFLPLPIVDGGQFLFILYEQVFKRPVPVSFQNAATLAGLILIGSMFLIVTFNDITNLFRS